jgi:hypothetical protein
MWISPYLHEPLRGVSNSQGSCKTILHSFPPVSYPRCDGCPIWYLQNACEESREQPNVSEIFSNSAMGSAHFNPVKTLFLVLNILTTKGNYLFRLNKEQKALNTDYCYRWSLVRVQIRDMLGEEMGKFAFGKSVYRFMTSKENNTSLYKIYWNIV